MSIDEIDSRNFALLLICMSVFFILGLTGVYLSIQLKKRHDTPAIPPTSKVRNDPRRAFTVADIADKQMIPELSQYIGWDLSQKDGLPKGVLGQVAVNK